MSTARRCLLVLILAIVGGCGGQPAVTPAPSAASPAASGGSPGAISGEGFEAFRAAVPALAGQLAGTVDVRRDRLVAALGLRTTLGAEADQILTLAQAVEAAAAAKPISRTDAHSPGEIISVVARAPEVARPAVSALTFPGPSHELRYGLPLLLDAVGRPGSGTKTDGPTTVTATESGGGLSASAQMTTTWTVTLQGSNVRLEIKRDVHTVVTEVASGTSVLDETKHYTIDGQINVCPSAAGIVDASVHNAVDSDARTSPGAGGRVGSHATAKLTSASAFRGEVDDAATLGAVSQDYNHDEEWHRTASADGGPEAVHDGAFGINESGIQDGVPTAHEYSLALGDHSTATGTPHLTGDATQTDLTSTALSAAQDYSTIDQAIVEAERLWRRGRCVMVSVPAYDAETNLETSQQDFVAHTEEVDKGSKSTFDASLKHRFGGTVAAAIEANLVKGKESLEPDSIPTPPGTLTYTAPDEDGKDAIVKLVSTSKQGIGTLVLQFHTGAKKLKVSITGKLTSSGYGVKFVTTVSVPKVVLSKQDDGTYRGSGSLTARVTVAGICPTPITEKGTIKLRATREEVEDQTLARGWTVSWDQTGNVTTSAKCLGQDIGSLLQVGPAGFSGMFMTVLGDVEFNEDGGTKNVKRSMAFGASQNTIDATVKAEIVSESNP